MKTSNNEYYVSLEVAKLLEEAGFDWECKTYYDTSIYLDETIIEDKLRDYNFMNGSIRFSAPTLDVAQRWLREVKKMCIVVFPVENRFTFVIVDFSEKLDLDDYILEYYTYEEAQEEGIKHALKIILNKGE